MKKSFFGFQKSIFIETLKRVRVPAIISAVAALISGIIGGCSLFGRIAPENINNPFDTACFFACGLIMLIVGIHVAASLHKKDTAELYGSVPVSRDSMWTSGLVAALALGIGMIAITLIGILVGRLIMHEYFNIGSFGYNYFELLPAVGKTILFGIADYAIAVIALSVTNKIFSAIVTVAIAEAFCIETYFALSVESRFGLSLWELILPINSGLRTAIGWILLVLLAAAALFLSRKAFMRIRIEDSLPVKKGIVQIIVGMMLSADIMMIFVNFASISRIRVTNIICGAVLSVIAYLIYSLIVCKKFLPALKRFMFYPLSVVFCLLVYIGSILFGKLYDKLDFSAGNIDYIEVTGSLIGSGNYYSIEYESYIGAYSGAESTYKGSGKEAAVRLYDSELKNRISKVMNSGWETSYLTAILWDSNVFYGSNDNRLPICITLKDGTKYYTDASFAYQLTSDVKEYIMEYEAEYREALTETAEFEEGHFLYMDKSFDEIYSQFVEELSALSVEERIYLMGCAGSTDTPCVTMLRIANKDNTLVRTFMLSNLTPKTLEKYCELSNKLIENDEIKLVIEEIMSGEGTPIYYNLGYAIYDTVTHEATENEVGFSVEYYSERIISYNLFKKYFEPYLFEGEDIEARYDEYMNDMLAFGDFAYSIEYESFKEMFDFGSMDDEEIAGLYDLYVWGYYSEIGCQYPDEERINAADLFESEAWELITEIAANTDDNSRYKLIVLRLEVESDNADRDGISFYAFCPSSGSIINEYAWTWNLSDEQYEKLMKMTITTKPGAEGAEEFEQ